MDKLFLIPKHKVQTTLLSGVCRLTSGIEIHYLPTGPHRAEVGISQGATDGDVWFSAEDCREVAEFFTNLSSILEKQTNV